MSVVWIVDDSPAVSEVVGIALTKKGYDVTAYAGGLPALDALKQGVPDVILLDLMMPDIDGFTTLERIRLTHDKAQLPVIVLTAHDSHEERARAMTLGANDFISKPPSLRNLFARVEKLCAAAAADDELPMVGVYKVLEQLGVGGMATVFRALDTDLGMPVALKVLRAELSQNPAFQVRFDEEVRILSAISHPGVVRFHGVERLADGGQALIMEYVEGAPFTEAGLDAAGALRAAADTLETLAHLHEHSIVHRDITAGNVLVTPRGDVKIVDFGISTMGEPPSRLTKAGAIVGSPSMLSPERFEGVVHPSTDAYAVACLLHEVLEGRPPYDPALAPEVLAEQKSKPLPRLSARARGKLRHPDSVDRLLRALTAPNANKRPPSALAVADGFRLLMSS